MPKDKRLRWAVGIALLEWVVVGVLVLAGVEGTLPLVVGVLGLGGVLQFTLLFARWRHQRGPLGQAQAAFMAGDYAAALSMLEQLTAQQTQARTLLGNTYRQLGRLEESAAILHDILQNQPNDPYPRYGLGRTLLVQGNYAEAAEHIRAALNNGGHKPISAELAQAYTFMGDTDRALRTAQRSSRLLQLEPHRALWVNYVLHQFDPNDQRARPTMQRNASGLVYWESEAARFAETPYGVRLKEEIIQMRALLRGAEVDHAMVD
ncbi:MAG: tetratricopeptide repeat protein [Anaerolineae bacterium]|nr:tetratricopeptide repeat protein [Anaerolineae bacterium]